MMLRILSFLILMGAGFQAMAALDLSPYRLKEKQIDLIRRLEAKGMDDITLIKFAKQLDYDNHPEEHPQVYIPPHTLQELQEVSYWAEGGAFRMFARDAGFGFDFQAYIKDCPNPQLFNFARATGTEHLAIDVMMGVNRVMYALNYKWATSPQTFREDYLAMIEVTPFIKYLVIESSAPEVLAVSVNY